MSVFLLLIFCLPLVSTSRILATFPTISKSHFLFFQPLLVALASRGHQVTVISNFPLDHPLDNYTEISLHGYKTVFSNNIEFQIFPSVPVGYIPNVMFLYFDIATNEAVFDHPEVKKLLESQEKIDLVLTEIWNNDIFLGFAKRFKAPAIAMSSSCILPWGNDRFGNPDNPSYVPIIFHDKMGHLDVLQRLTNTVKLVLSKLVYDLVFTPAQEKITHRVFGDSLPPLKTLAKNVSLLFTNTHFTLQGSRPFSPQVIEVGGIHVKEPKPLSKELAKWMNESTEGVIYFSFGSMLRGATLPTDKVKSFLKVFETLPQRVLWKWEDDTIDGLPKNVKIMKWLPQRDILAHPNVKVFISHGGLLGTTEAVVSGVPILGIPMYGDQPNNVAALVENSVAIHVDYNNISVASLSYALNTLIYDKSYSQNAKELSRRFLDRPMSPLDTAVYWTEYVIRHKGAPHLQSAAVHLPWYQYYLLDVIGVLIAVLLVLLAFVYYTVKYCLRLVLPKKSTKLKKN